MAEIWKEAQVVSLYLASWVCEHAPIWHLGYMQAKRHEGPRLDYRGTFTVVTSER